jgi:hypothetical protein
MGRDPLGPVVLGACCPITSPADISRVIRGAQAVEVQVEGGGPSVLVLLQTYTPDWKATVDGRPVQLMPADVLFQGVSSHCVDHVVQDRLWHVFCEFTRVAADDALIEVGHP